MYLGIGIALKLNNDFSNLYAHDFCLQKKKLTNMTRLLVQKCLAVCTLTEQTLFVYKLCHYQSLPSHTCSYKICRSIILTYMPFHSLATAHLNLRG